MPSLDFHIDRGLLRRCQEWASRGPVEASSGPSVFVCTRYPQTQESWGHPLVSSPRVPGGLEESRRDSLDSPVRVVLVGGGTEVQAGSGLVGGMDQAHKPAWHGPAHTTSNSAPNKYRGVVNPSGLAVYKG